MPVFEINTALCTTFVCTKGVCRILFKTLHYLSLQHHGVAVRRSTICHFLAPLAVPSLDQFFFHLDLLFFTTAILQKIATPSSFPAQSRTAACGPLAPVPDQPPPSTRLGRRRMSLA